MKPYPKLIPSNLEEVIELLRYITKERPLDINDFDNLQNRFMAGRKVGKIPADFSDVDPSDRVGDFNVFIDSGVPYLVVLIDDGGTGKWARFTGDIAW
jgi:hypothetical protein